MSQGSSQWEAGGSQPPSFLPAGTPKHRVRTPSAPAQPATGQVVPPSFSPAQGRTSGSRAASSAPRAGAAQSVRQSARVSGGSSCNATNNEHAMESSANDIRRPSSSRGPSGPARPRRHISAGRVFSRFIVVLLVAVIVAGIAAYDWVNSNLSKSAWLSDMSSGQATSWLILGSDERDGSINESSGDVPGTRTDTILVLTKPKSGPSSLISIPRDSLVKVDDKSMKINAVYELYGKKSLVGAVENITGQKIDHVAMVKFGGVQDVVNALGGVELCYDSTVNDANSGLVWQAGCHVADGGTALAFSRMRYSDPQGDFGRAARQRQVIAAIMKKATSRSTLTSFSTTSKVAKTALASVSVDDKTTPTTLLAMVMAFRSASSSKGISGSVYWTDQGYYVADVGSCVLLDDDKNLQLFSELAAGTHASGSVGTLAEAS